LVGMSTVCAFYLTPIAYEISCHTKMRQSKLDFTPPRGVQFANNTKQYTFLNPGLESLIREEYNWQMHRRGLGVFDTPSLRRTTRANCTYRRTY
jgi:hypothetical protein